jgi:hypothetical protein
MTDTSAGLTPRHIATCGRCGITFGKDEPFFNVFCPECPKGGMRGVLNSDPTEPSEADALLADLRGKLDRMTEVRDEWARRATDQAVQFEIQLEAERAKVREMQALLQRVDELQELNPSNYSHEDVCDLNWNVCQIVLAIRAALPASVDAKGADRG